MTTRMPDDAAYSFAKELYANVSGWYATAETKAQVILTLNGAFISFIAGSLLQKRDDLRPIIGAFGVETWLLLSVMTVSTLLAVISAVWCLRARGLTEKRRSEVYRRLNVDPHRADTIDVGAMWFFFLIAGLDPGAFAKRVLEIDSSRAAAVLATDAVILAGYVTTKHIWINRGFFFSGVALVSFTLLALSYLIRVAAN